jgi:hypothetical protein
MPVKFKVVAELPGDLGQRGPRTSTCRDAVTYAAKHFPDWAEVTAGSKQELEKFYRALIQWRSRHKHELEIEIRKGGGAVYVRAATAARRRLARFRLEGVSDETAAEL